MITRGIRRIRSFFSRRPNTGRVCVPPEIYPDDVFLVSYPKSGSTWVRFIITYLILGTFDDSVDFKTVQEMTPDIHMVEPYGISLDVPRPRIIKSHCAFVADYPRVVYLVRDGRDVAVSFYHHQKKMRGYSGTFQEFVEADFQWSPSWSQHVDSWLFGHHASPVLPIRYEDLSIDAADLVEELCSFAGIPATSTEIESALHWSRFDRLRRVEEERGLGYVDGGNDNLKFVRKGERGNWDSLFDDAAKRIFRQRHQATLQRLGYVTSPDW